MKKPKRDVPSPGDLEQRVLARLKTSTFDRTASGLAHELREDIFAVTEALRRLYRRGLVETNEIKNPAGQVSCTYWWAVNNPPPGTSK